MSLVPTNAAVDYHDGVIVDLKCRH